MAVLRPKHQNKAKHENVNWKCYSSTKLYHREGHICEGECNKERQRQYETHRLNNNESRTKIKDCSFLYINAVIVRKESWLI